MKKKYKTKMRSTSIEAFVSILEKLPKCRMKVFKAMKKINKPCSNYMISKHLNWPINRITGRTNELRKLGMVVFHHKEICQETKAKVDYWVIPAWQREIMV